MFGEVEWVKVPDGKRCGKNEENCSMAHEGAA